MRMTSGAVPICVKPPMPTGDSEATLTVMAENAMQVAGRIMNGIERLIGRIRDQPSEEKKDCPMPNGLESKLRAVNSDLHEAERLLGVLSECIG